MLKISNYKSCALKNCRKAAEDNLCKSIPICGERQMIDYNNKKKCNNNLALYIEEVHF